MFRPHSVTMEERHRLFKQVIRQNIHRKSMQRYVTLIACLEAFRLILELPPRFVSPSDKFSHYGSTLILIPNAVLPMQGQSGSFHNFRTLLDVVFKGAVSELRPL